MLDLQGSAHLGYTRNNNMGGAASKFFRREVIDLTGEDNEPVRQRPLPLFDELLRNNPFTPPRSAIQRETTPSPLTALERALQPNLGDEEANAPTREAFESSHPAIFDAPPRRRQWACKAIPSRTEVIDLISPDGSPEPASGEEPPLARFRRALRNLSRRTRPTRVAVRATSPGRRSMSVVLNARSQPATENGSANNPIVIFDTPIRESTPLPVVPASPSPAELVPAPWATLVLFSDGSAIRDRFGGAGVAFWDNDQWSGKAFALGIVSGSYEAEARAIMEAFKLAHRMIGPHHKAIEVRTDHQGLVESFYGRKGRQDQWIPKLLNTASLLSDLDVLIKLTWVKGHDEHAGNQMADRLARLAAERAEECRPRPWFPDSVREVQVSNDLMLTFSNTSEMCAYYMLETKNERAERKRVRRVEKLGQRGARKVERRNRKLTLRAQSEAKDEVIGWLQQGRLRARETESNANLQMIF